ncbi:LPS assembly protein LptD [Thiomicrospira sp. R3]|uniref:LPS-assembly protein LptD n=1 Tax=Thiomicrospira sp. R3 TaxID=3035472 RepID=UPI00259B6014|nr:LPS assembly protein LptD [Thiomicrospira sp. R3]WFE68153.1 LPS assembly protein LptD [Thiomicrospira sp. R3]
MTLQSVKANDAGNQSSPLTCGIEWLFPLKAIPEPNSIHSARFIEADQLSQPSSFQVNLIGSVLLSEPGLVVMADKLDYDRSQQAMVLQGNIELHSEHLLIQSQTAYYSQAEQTAQLDRLRYQLKPSGYHGQASQLRFDGQQQNSLLNQATFTTCSLDNPAWQLNFSQLEINQQTRRIYGHHGYLSVKGLPLLYTPYINVPLDNRATGFLFPTFGSHKPAALSNSQTLFALPFYWVIADNYDATFNFMALEQRGLLLDTEWRYLQPSHRGEINLGMTQDQQVKTEGLTYLDPTGQRQTLVANQTRWRASLNSQQNWGENLNSQLLWHEVSDPDFYNDFPLGFNASTLNQYNQNQFRVRQALVRYQQAHVQAHIQHYGYLPLRNGEQAVLEKSPEIGFNWARNWGGWHTGVYAEATEFKRYAGFNNFADAGYVRAQALGNQISQDPYQHQGQRLVLQPSLTYRVDQPYGFAQAQMQANYRHYQLSNAPDKASRDNLVMQYALSAGLIFERDLQLANSSYIQTLEPQIQWLYVPYSDQSHLSLFDTGLNSLDFSNLFQLNRFTGFDRIGDTQQISAALTNRLFNDEGEALGEFSFGQVFFLKDRKVGLIGNPAQDNQRSDYFVRLASQINHFNFSSTSQFDQQSLKLNQTLNRLKWHGFAPIQLLAIHQGLALDQPEQRQQTLANGLILQLTPSWQAASYINYDLEQRTYREFSAGLRYDSCCWASELMFMQDQMADGRYNYTVKYVIELKGLSSMGQRLSDQIQQNLNF